MIRTAYPPLLNVPVLQRRAPVRTVQTQHPQLPLEVSKEHQLFPQNLQPLRNVSKVRYRADNEPVPAKPLTSRRSSTNVRNITKCDLAVFLCATDFHG